MVRYDMGFEGWHTEGSIAAPSHPSEGWYEKGHMSSQYPDALSVEGLLKAMFKSRSVYGLGVFFSKKRQQALGVGRTNPGNP
jgi:hypothetical protein